MSEACRKTLQLENRCVGIFGVFGMFGLCWRARDLFLFLEAIIGQRVKHITWLVASPSGWFLLDRWEKLGSSSSINLQRCTLDEHFRLEFCSMHTEECGLRITKTSLLFHNTLQIKIVANVDKPHACCAEQTSSHSCNSKLYLANKISVIKADNSFVHFPSWKLFLLFDPWYFNSLCRFRQSLWRTLSLQRCPRSYCLVVRKIACRARRLRFKPSSDQMLSLLWFKVVGWSQNRIMILR